LEYTRLYSFSVKINEEDNSIDKNNIMNEDKEEIDIQSRQIILHWDRKADEE